jgi:hypothetical protein
MARSRPAAVLALLLAAAPAGAVPSVGEPVVYVSPDGSGTPPPSSPWKVAAEDGQQLVLYLDYENSPDVGASQSGTMCIDADGDETCGFDVLIELSSDVATLASFAPPAGCDTDPDCSIVGSLDPTSHVLRVNGIDISGMPIPAPIGTLQLDAAGANDLQITARGMHRVGAAGQLDAIQTRELVALPEPGLLWQLGCGLLGLGLLSRRRRCSGHRHPLG